MKCKEFLDKKKTMCYYCVDCEGEIFIDGYKAHSKKHKVRDESFVSIKELGDWAFNRVEEIMNQKTIFFKRNTKELQDLAIACLGEETVLKKISELKRNKGV